MSPNAAGALCSMMARKITNSTSVLEVLATAPSAIPSAWTGEREGRKLVVLMCISAFLHRLLTSCMHQQANGGCELLLLAHNDLSI